MRKLIDLKGENFGSWVVISEASKLPSSLKGKKFGNRRWNCKCKCGLIKILYQSSLTSNGSKGCKKCRIQTHNITHGQRNHRLYNRWCYMRQRCLNPRDKNYIHYGKRGIKICERWMDFSKFLEDMESTFKEGLTIERVNNDGDYELSNCIWATREEQNRNKRH